MSEYKPRGRGRQAGTPIRAAGRVVGEVRGDTFYKSLAARHFLQKPPAIALDLSSLNDVERLGVRYCEILDRDTGRVYRAAISTIRARGFRVSRGFGEQWALALAEWRKDSEPAGEQLSLFGVPA